MATVTAASVSSSDSVERFRQEFNTLRSDVSNIQSGSLTITNESNNRILTSVSTNTFNAESGLTYDGSTFAVTGAVTVSGLTTLSSNLIIPNAGNIGSDGDNDSIAIASDGVVTFSQAPVFPDGSLAVDDLDIDGATDIGAGLADADLFIVDDAAGGTNRKSAASRIKTYIADVTLTTAAQTNITSLGTLTTLTVDNIIINGTNIGHTSDTDAIAIASDGKTTFSQQTTHSGGILVADAGNIGSASDADAIAISSAGLVTLSQDLTMGHDGAVINFGGDSEIALTHNHNVGLKMTSTAYAPLARRGEDVFIVLDGTDASSADDGDNVIMDRSAADGTDAGDDIIGEDEVFLHSGMQRNVIEIRDSGGNLLNSVAGFAPGAI